MSSSERLFTAVMAAGILSIAAQLAGIDWLSLGLLAVGCGVLAASVAAYVTRRIRPPSEARWVLVFLTLVAACGVIAQRFGDLSPDLADAFATIAFIAFAVAVAAIVRTALQQRSSVSIWPVRGSWLLAVVALQSVSILLSAWVPAVAASAWVIALAAYVCITGLIVRRLAIGAVRVDALTPDYWITMGALAISTVALFAFAPPHWSTALGLAVWAAAALWIPFLCVAEVLRGRRQGMTLRYDAARWSTVFPLGMFSVASHDVARATGAGAFYVVATVMLWAGLAVAALNLGGALAGRRWAARAG